MSNEKMDSMPATAPAHCASMCPLGGPALEQLIKALTPRPFRKRHPVLFWGFWMLAILGVGGGIYSSMDEKPSLASDDRLAIVRVEGAILNTRPLLRWIDKVKRDPSVKGVLLRIDSPGGGAAAAQEVFEAVKSLGARKPVVASMGSVAASGGLMVAMGAQQVVANPSTVTGSIGVRMDIPQMQDLMGKLGIGQETLTTGRYKDAGSTMRPLNADERQYLNRILQDMHEQFVQLVAEGRKMPVEKARELADGRIFTGREARELGIVDSLGGQDEALQSLHELTGLPPGGKLLEQPKENTLWKELVESLLGLELTTLASGLESSSAPRFYFAY